MHVPEKNIGKVQARHVEFNIGKVQARHVNLFPLPCLIEENQNKFLYFLFRKYWFRQQNPDMCQKKIDKVQPRHADLCIGKVQPRHVTRFPLVCLIVKNHKKISLFYL